MKLVMKLVKGTCSSFLDQTMAFSSGSGVVLLKQCTLFMYARVQLKFSGAYIQEQYLFFLFFLCYVCTSRV